MSLENNTTCVFCLVDFVDEDEVRTVHPTKGLVFPTSHTFPDGQNMFGRRIPGICRDKHDEPHIHEKCIAAWEDKFNLETPVTREEAIKAAGISRFSIFGPLHAKYTTDEVSEIFDPILGEDAFSEIFAEEEEPELDVAPLTDMYDYVEEEMAQAILEEEHEYAQREDCPLDCPHKLDEHWEITTQVLKCKHCECTF